MDRRRLVIVAGPGGVVYGTTARGAAASTGCTSGCGTVFALTPAASSGGPWTETVLHSFGGLPSDGAEPNVGLIIGTGGVLYGTTALGGTVNDSCPSGCGTVFSMSPPTSLGGLWTETVLYGLAHTTYSGVAIGGGGRLFGTIGGPGSHGGTVYELRPPASPSGAGTETVIHQFREEPTDGSQPYAGVVIGSGGVLYGATESGGLDNFGTVFSVTPPASAGGSWTETVLYNFSGASFPEEPTAALAIGNGGVLYGTTGLGGVLGWGTVFASKPPSSPGGSWTEVTLHDFTGADDGSDPIAPLTFTANGMLYGTTYQGGTSNFGTVFSLKP
jgi:uncharacterized repeat protein (TIGR03803 family)